jgi:hypothetical protein
MSRKYRLGHRGTVAAGKLHEIAGLLKMEKMKKDAMLRGGRVFSPASARKARDGRAV